MKKAKIALLIGRFQPFHKGHLYLMRKAIETAEKLVIGIGSANIDDENNPLDFETRKKIIKAVIYKEKFGDKVKKIVGLDDFFDDKKWLNNVKKQAGDFDLVIGNNNWTNNIMEKAGYRVRRFPYYKRYLYEGWRIRKLISEGKKWQDRIPRYIVKWLTYHIDNNNNIAVNHYDHVVLGGTFDHFHKGHRIMINTAFRLGNRVTIGVATGKLLDKKLMKSSIESFNKRKFGVKRYISSDRKKNNRYKIVSFSDIYAQTLTDKSYEAIIVSRATLGNANKINIKRKEKGFPEMRIVVVGNILDESGKLLSSERIRAGEVNKEGLVYENLFKKNLHLPDNLREDLRKPLGKVFKKVHQVIKFIKLIRPLMTIAVGDIISMTLEKEGIRPDVKIIDNRSRRQEILNPNPPADGQTSNLINKPGTINSDSSKAINLNIKKFISTKKKQTVIIKGEEDLLALPAILMAPLNGLVLYGHWQLGIIAVEVNELKKYKIVNIINKFK